jgi:lipid-binding SYLF domain-containing protein
MRGNRNGKARIRWIACIWGLTAWIVAGPHAVSHATDLDDAQTVVERARITFGEFLRDGNYGWMHGHLRDAKGVLIYPQVLKGGFILGGSGGTGVLLVRDENTGEYSQPAFYTVGSVSFGLQIGGEAAEVVMLVMSRKGIDSLLTSKVNLGGDVSIAIGPVGGGAKGDVTTDFISFAKSKGLYAGLNLDGSYLAVRDGLNRAYYGKETTPADILIRKSVSNKDSDRLREELRKAAK